MKTYIWKRQLSIIQKFLINIINSYQKFLSPDHSLWAKNNVPYCKHFPTCSEYMKESIEKKWTIIWMLKWTLRILRCMPWNKWWYNPVEK